MLPDRLVPFEELLAAPDVIDQDIKAALLGADAIDQLSNLIGDEMIDLDGDALAAGCRDQLGRLLDGFRPGVFGLLVARRPSGHIDRCARGAQFDRDASTRTARSAGDQGDFSFKRHRTLPKVFAPSGCHHRKVTPLANRSPWEQYHLSQSCGVADVVDAPGALLCPPCAERPKAEFIPEIDLHDSLR